MEYFKGLSRKEYIIKASDIIEKEGVEALSIRKLAKELGCSSASLYRYFSGLDELIYFSALRDLKDYIGALNKYSKVWKNALEMYVGVWHAYATEAFKKPVAYNLLFLAKNDLVLKEAIDEYYTMFPEDELFSSNIFGEMLKNPDFVGRDYEISKICVKEGLISADNAKKLSRITCMLFKGYFKTYMDEGMPEKEISKYVDELIEDIEVLIISLANDTKGYASYKDVLKRV